MKIKLGLLFVGLVLVSAVWNISLAKGKAGQVFSVEELGRFDGTDPNKPIYIGMNGLVYDVTGGQEYYVSGGPYHDLVGRDSSEELNAVGSEIIKRKYPVVGSLKK